MICGLYDEATLISVDSKSNKLRILISLVGNQNASRLLIENAKGRKMSGSVLVKKFKVLGNLIGPEPVRQNPGLCLVELNSSNSNNQGIKFIDGQTFFS